MAEKNNQKSIISKVESLIIKKGLIKEGEKIAIALSGGPDSIALASVLFLLQAKVRFQLFACHYNHRLRGEESDKDEVFVKNFCKEKGIVLFSGHAGKENQFKSEEAAREARYGFFDKLIDGKKIDKIAIAHNLNDQAETYLMRLLRGSGLRGLSSIPYARGKFIRPLLDISRIEIEAFLSGKNIEYRTDQSNFDTTLSRNKIRHELLPLLAAYNSNIVETLANNALQAGADYGSLANEAAGKLTKMTLLSGTGQIVLDAKAWREENDAMKNLIMRIAVERIDNLIDITYKQMQEVAEMIEKGVGKKYKLLPHSLRIELRDGKIFIIKHNTGDKQ